jgi:hypothetical protein
MDKNISKFIVLEYVTSYIRLVFFYETAGVDASAADRQQQLASRLYT